MSQQIIIGAWWPVPKSKPHLNYVVPIDTLALDQLFEELNRELPEYVVVRRGHAMGGMHPVPVEIIRWLVDVEVPWRGLAGPAAKVMLDIIAGVITGFLLRRTEVDAQAEKKHKAPPLREEPPFGPNEDVIDRITIYGPEGQVLSNLPKVDSRGTSSD